MTPERREQLRREAQVSWAKKTPEERRASKQRLFDEILNDACDAIYRITCKAVTEQLVTGGATDQPLSRSGR